MRQLQVTVPSNDKKEVKEVLEKFSNDINLKDAERDGRKFVEIEMSAESDDIDNIVDELKDLKDIDSGDLSIHILKQESLIRKGSKTKGSASQLSREELYSKAQESVSFDVSQWGLIAVSAMIAAYGIALDNIVTVVGAMMLAPLLSPFISSAASITFGDRGLFIKALKIGTASVLSVILFSYIAVLPVSVELNSTFSLIVSAGILNVVLSLLVGVAAALSFSTGLRDQIAGVAVAIALVPPLASMGLAAKMTDISLFLQAGSVAFTNILSVISAGYLTFLALGVRPSTYYRKKQAVQLKQFVPVVFALIIVLAGAIVQLNNTDGSAVVSEAEAFFGPDLLKVDTSASGHRVYVVGNYSGSEFQEKLPDGVKVTVIGLQRTN